MVLLGPVVLGPDWRTSTIDSRRDSRVGGIFSMKEVAAQKNECIWRDVQALVWY